MKYRKKPVVVEASQWWKLGDHPNVEQYMDGVAGELECGDCGALLKEHGFIQTLEGGHIVCLGDWIITGVKGEQYPCKPDIFPMLYEEAGL